jgi:hypothetical protein
MPVVMTATDAEPTLSRDASARARLRHFQERYLASVRALREFFGSLLPVVAGLDDKTKSEMEAKAEALFESFAMRADPSELKALLEVLSYIAQRPRRGTVSLTDASPHLIRTVEHMVRGMMREAMNPSHRSTLSRSILVSLVGSFEMLMADLVTTFLKIHPESLEASAEKQLSLSEIKNLGSIDDAYDFVISVKVDAILRGDLDEWAKFFESRANISLAECCPDWHQFRELIQRRHIIVHNDGRSNALYASKVDFTRVTFPESVPAINSSLPLTDEYVALALDLFEVTGVMCCRALARKISLNEDQQSLLTTQLLDYVYEAVVESRWFVVEHVCRFIMNDLELPASAKFTATFNYWLSVKRQQRWDEVVADVRRFDCSAVHPRYAMARAALLEDAEAFFKLAPEVELEDVNYWRAWPILEEVRCDPRWEAFVSAVEAEAARREESRVRLDPTVRAIAGDRDGRPGSIAGGDVGQEAPAPDNNSMSERPTSGPEVGE